TNKIKHNTTLITRHLGKGYICQPVFRYRSPDTTKAAAVVGRGDRVVLLPMLPHRCGTVSSAVVAANTALSDRRANVTSVASYPDFTGYVEAFAETVRAALADLPQAHHTTYEVLFCAQLPTESRSGTPDPDHHDEVERTVAAAVAAVGLVRPHHIGYISALTRIRQREQSTSWQLKDLVGRGVSAAVVVPVGLSSDQLGTVVSLDQALARQAEEGGVAFIRAETVATRPTFIRALAALVRQAERDAEWGR
ncbi:MAG: ferrochelatase, partial [Myxococcota bacterium]